MHISTTTDTSKKTGWRKDRGGKGCELDLADTVRRRQDRIEIEDGLSVIEGDGESYLEREFRLAVEELQLEWVDLNYNWDHELDGLYFPDWQLCPMEIDRSFILN
jgi:hypothetical protein